MRIISLVPSQTELLGYLGLESEVVGITKFCVHPNSWFKSKDRVGGTKTLDIAKIVGLRPDLILANKEENIKEQVDVLSKEFDVYVSDIHNLNDALEMIQNVGKLTSKITRAQDLIDKINKGFNEIACDSKPLKSALYLIWNNPIMVAGTDTFISDMMRLAGFCNATVNLRRYPKLTESHIIQINPDYILLSSEPFPFKAKHKHYFEHRFPNSKVMLVDGEAFSWYGSRMLKTLEYFRELKPTV